MNAGLACRLTSGRFPIFQHASKIFTCFILCITNAARPGHSPGLDPRPKGEGFTRHRDVMTAKGRHGIIH
jgi:hypothetical protein